MSWVIRFGDGQGVTIKGAQQFKGRRAGDSACRHYYEVPGSLTETLTPLSPEVALFYRPEIEVV